MSRGRRILSGRARRFPGLARDCAALVITEERSLPRAALSQLSHSLLPSISLSPPFLSSLSAPIHGSGPSLHPPTNFPLTNTASPSLAFSFTVNSSSSDSCASPAVPGTKATSDSNEFNLAAARTFNALLEQSFIDRAPSDVPTYLTAAAGPSTSSAPRKFCSVCGFVAPYGCARCGMRFCSKKCSAVHAETRCLKMVG